jgi:GntR family transcriptional repressor for pyruvate dehydrogenase complex
MSDRVARTPQLSVCIASLVAAAIAEGRWKPGERLPTEQALADTYGVSRNVVREAVSRLRADGLVHSRQGVGAFVARTQVSECCTSMPNRSTTEQHSIMSLTA